MACRKMRSPSVLNSAIVKSGNDSFVICRNGTRAVFLLKARHLFSTDKSSWNSFQTTYSRRAALSRNDRIYEIDIYPGSISE